MPDKYIEKKFILVLCISLLLHLGSGAALYYYPQPRQEPPKEPVFIDLQQMPEPEKPVEQHPQDTKRHSEQRVRVPSESVMRDEAQKKNQTTEKPATASSEQQSVTPTVRPQPPQAMPGQPPGYSAASLLKPKVQTAQLPPSVQHLFPGASRLAKLEESYRHMFENDIAEGDTRFLNSDDIVFGSFLRRFEGAVYGVWRYPQEAAMKGIEGITPVRITFNRRGEITNIQQLESSGARILDEEVLRTLRAIGPMGGFPRGYDKEEFHLIAFFQYGGSKRSLR
ncbi:MAG: TonB family protein [Desulfuromonadales bacterium]